ncbi:Hgh1 protein [Saccharomycopsis crataegensis]|uniref:Protein HGH1 homolog n=1 Tax=Saccharomycopsis crataegensis TaxID=43959 RepID=A0AAV5QEV7_9ASCO|nr:Hgh1 protein [Saccharomycopsis crataegensis]
MSELQELVGFLGHENTVVKTVALQNLLGYSASNKDVFRPEGLQPIKDLIKITQEKGATNQKIALTILVNVSDVSEVRQLIIDDEEYLKYIVGEIQNDSPNAALYSMLLANLSFEPTFKLSKDQVEVLLAKYVLNQPQHDYLSLVFVNYTNKLEGRNFFLEDDNLSSIIVFNDSDNEKRKEGSGKLLKNLLFNIDSHLKLIENDQIKLLTYILSPLISSNYTLDDDEEFALPEELQFLQDKQMESNLELVAVYLECLLLLCTTKPVRVAMREASVYPVIRELHKTVNDQRVCELCEEIVQFLAREEAPEQEEAKITEEADDDFSDDDDKMIEVL